MTGGAGAPPVPIRAIATAIYTLLAFAPRAQDWNRLRRASHCAVAMNGGHRWMEGNRNFYRSDVVRALTCWASFPMSPAFLTSMAFMALATIGD